MGKYNLSLNKENKSLGSDLTLDDSFINEKNLFKFFHRKYLTEMILNFMNKYSTKILKLINYSTPKLILSINEGYIFRILFFQ